MRLNQLLNGMYLPHNRCV